MSRIYVSNRVEIFYHQRGEGTPFLLIGGLGCDIHFWDSFQIEPFSAHHKVIAYDNRGIGESDKPEGPYSIPQLADDAAGLLVALGIDKAHVLGVSMGGMISLELAIRHPDRVRSLVVACGTARSDGWMKAKQVVNQKLSALPADEKEMRELMTRTNLLWMFAPAFFEKPEVVERVLELMQKNTQPFDAYRWQSQALHDHDATHGLDKIKCPTLVMVGNQDILTPIRYAEEIVRGILGAKFKIIDGCGHLFMFEKPDEFNKTVLDFIDDVEKRESAKMTEDRRFEIPVEEGKTLDGFMRKSDNRWALLCRGLTGSLTRRSSFDELADALDRDGWSSLRFDYRGRGESWSDDTVPTVSTMIEDVKRTVISLAEDIGQLPDVVIARGYGARLALKTLVQYPDIPLIMWAPIIWLKTSLEIRGRMHQLRRSGHLNVDGTDINTIFLDSLTDPSDAQIREWIIPQRRHIIIQAKGDQVVPIELGEELGELISEAGGQVEIIEVVGTHPHPGMDVREQIRKIVEVLGDTVKM